MKKRIWHNGNIVTMQQDGHTTEALYCAGETIVALGNSETILQNGDANTEIVDLQGKTVIPGFIEPHNHVTDGFINEFIEVACHKATTIDEVLEEIAENAARLNEGEWVLGAGYNDTTIAEKRHLTRQDIDLVCPDIPVALFHVSGHVLYVNTKLLDICGISADSVIPEGGSGKIVIGEDGEPNGVLIGHAYMLAMSKAPKHTNEKYIQAYTKGMKIANSLGITSIQDGAIGWLNNQKEIVTALSRMKDEGNLSLRFYLTIMEEQFKPFMDSGCGTGFGNNEIRLGSVKYLLDGSIQAYTAKLSEPYHVEGTCDGLLHMTQGELDSAVLSCHEQHCQVAMHCNGDEAIDRALNAIEKAQQTYNQFEGRHLLIHAQTIREDQLDRAAALKCIPSFFANHIYYWGDAHLETFLGEKRAYRINPLASARRRDIPFTIHTDYIVTPLDPFRLISCAVNRKTQSGKILGEDQKISVYDAISALTVNAAYSSFEENLKGSLEAGKLADFIVLSEDIFSIDPEEICNVSVEQTIFGGKTVFKIN